MFIKTLLLTGERGEVRVLWVGCTNGGDSDRWKFGFVLTDGGVSPQPAHYGKYCGPKIF